MNTSTPVSRPRAPTRAFSLVELVCALGICAMAVQATLSITIQSLKAYAATVTSVAQFGFFCEIDPFPAEGLVSMASMSDDYYDYDPENYCLVGSRKKRRINIGDKLWVRVKRADWELLQVDFEALWSPPTDVLEE